jgi:arylsulfatase A-like enzyme
VAAGFGFDRGMDRYDVVWEIDAAVEQAKRFVDQHRDTPFFLFLHTYHVHDPYLPGRRARRFYQGQYRGKIVTDAAALRSLQRDSSFEEQRRAYWSLVNREDPDDMAYLVSLYDGEIWEVDRALGKLFEQVRRRVPDTLIIVVSDHGEQFLEHGGILHNDLYQELLHVPLIVGGPGVARGRRISTPVSLVDLAPTALDLLGLPVPAQFQGRSQAPALKGAEPATRDIFSEKAGRKTALLTRGSKLIVSVDRLPELYDLNRDAKEKNNLAWNVPRVLGLAGRLGEIVEANQALRAELRGSAPASEERADLDSRTDRQLKALGYIE